jgi:hypothetical protein
MRVMKELREVSRRLGSKMKQLKKDIQHQAIELMALTPECAIEFVFNYNGLDYSVVINVDAFVIVWEQGKVQEARYGGGQEVAVDEETEGTNGEAGFIVLNLADIITFSSDEILLVRTIMPALIMAYTKKLKEVEVELNDTFDNYLDNLLKV